MKRTNLVMHLVCNDCGRVLEIDGEIGPAAYTIEEPPLPTGAANLSAGSVRVRPCEHCVGRLRQAAKDVADGIAALQRYTDP